MGVPSIKGSAFQSVVEDVRRLVDEGRLEPADLARELGEKDRGYLDSMIAPVGWFPIETYGHMLGLLASEEGGADPIGYLRERGARAAERLLSGTYESLSPEPGSWGPRVGQTMLGIGKLLYNFTVWTFRQVSDEIFEIEVREAQDYPEVARHTAQGFLHWFAEHAAGRPMRVASMRTSPDHVVFRIEPD